MPILKQCPYTGLSHPIQEDTLRLSATHPHPCLITSYYPVSTPLSNEQAALLLCSELWGAPSSRHPYISHWGLPFTPAKLKALKQGDVFSLLVEYQLFAHSREGMKLPSFSFDSLQSLRLWMSLSRGVRAEGYDEWEQGCVDALELASGRVDYITWGGKWFYRNAKGKRTDSMKAKLSSVSKALSVLKSKDESQSFGSTLAEYEFLITCITSWRKRNAEALEQCPEQDTLLGYFELELRDGVVRAKAEQKALEGAIIFPLPEE